MVKKSEFFTLIGVEGKEFKGKDSSITIFRVNGGMQAEEKGAAAVEKPAAEEAAAEV